MDTNYSNVLETTLNEPFILSETSLDYFLDSPRHIPNGVVIFCTSGTATITLNMQRCEVSLHSRIIIMPQNVLMLESKSDDFSTICFAFSTPMFDEACFRLEPDFFGFLNENFHFLFPTDVFDKHMYYIEIVRSLYEDRGNRFRVKMTTNILQNFFLETFDKVYRYTERMVIQGADRPNELYKKFIHLVHKYFKQVREVSFYANELSISTRYLNTITQRTDKITPKEFIDNCVIQEIKLMLHTPNVTVQQIASDLNFPDQSYLARFFKSRTGMSPSEYKRRGREYNT